PLYMKLLVSKSTNTLVPTKASGRSMPEISSRNSRVAALQNRQDRLRAGLDLILDQWGADMADLPPPRERFAGAEAWECATRCPMLCWEFFFGCTARSPRAVHPKKNSQQSI